MRSFVRSHPRMRILLAAAGSGASAYRDSYRVPGVIISRGLWSRAHHCHYDRHQGRRQ